MKNHFKREVWIMWLSVAIPIVVAIAAAFIVPHFISKH
jgi:hypothetical protein